VPLDWGRCPRWLFERMTRLGRGICVAIVEEFGPEELLRRLSDPAWFQSLGCVMGFDWNSSGLTVTTMGALKEAVRGMETDLGFYVCGGKRVSRKTPEETAAWGQKLGWTEEKTGTLVFASRMAAKVDSALGRRERFLRKSAFGHCQRRAVKAAEFDRRGEPGKQRDFRADGKT